MTKSALPFIKTAWFYLLLVLLAAFSWSLSTGGFNSLSLMNQKLLSAVVSLPQKSVKVIHIEFSLKLQNFERVTQLLSLYPDNPIVFTEQPSNEFGLNLAGFLKENPRKLPIIFATNYIQSMPELTEENLNKQELNPYLFNLFDYMRIPELTEIQWRVSSDAAYMPMLVDAQNRQAILWRSKDKIYLSALGEIVRQHRERASDSLILDESMTFKRGWNIELKSQQESWTFGFDGYSIALDNQIVAHSMNDILANKKIAGDQVFIIGASISPITHQLIQSAQGLLQHQYLTQSLFTQLLGYCLLIAGILLIVYICRLKKLIQLYFMLVFCFLLMTVQYLSFLQMQWLAIIPILGVSIITWWMSLAYQIEVARLDKLQKQKNIFLADLLTSYFQSKTFAEFMELLNSSQPDYQLVDKVFLLALENEQKSQVEFNKLLGWIQTSNVKHAASKQKIVELNSDKQGSKAKKKNLITQLSPKSKWAKEHNDTLDSERESTFEKTMVIQPGQQNPSFNMNAPYQVENFGRYKVEGILGKGAMGIVYQGVDPKINRHVAIKTLQLSDCANPEDLDEAKARFFKEAETAGNLSHANIVTVYDVGEEADLGYIAMDLLTGAPLSRYIKPKNKLPTALVYQLMIQITDALDYAHRQNVVHRDIKPANIIYDDDIHRVTVTDFGIAYVADNSKTRTGTIMGSPYYMSPEQILGLPVDGRSDIFSLGVTFYQLLCGYLPFEGESIASVAYQITHSKQVSVKKWHPKLPASAARLTNKAMHKDIDKRFQTMQEFKLALINALKRDFKKAPII